MNNIADFIAYRDLCPVCNNSLNFHFNYKGNKTLRFVDQELCVAMQVNDFPSSKNKKRFKITYLIDFNTNEFKIEFPDDIGENLKHVPLNRLEDCKAFTSAKGMQLYKDCGICNQYSYNSTYLRFDFKSSQLLPCKVWKESIYIIKRMELDAKRYELNNNYMDKNSILLYDKVDNIKFWGTDSMTRSHPIKHSLSIPIVKITEQTELIERLETFITFS